MLRGLYRFYLYTVFIAMLIFAVVGAQHLLQVLFARFLFKEPYYTPTAADIVQAIVLVTVSWIIAALFGGLHYWLIRRDMHDDPSAGNGAMRAFFLNFVELISLPLAVGIGAGVIAGLGQQYSSGASSGVAFAITTLALWAVLEWERRRAQASSGAASVFQRLQLYGVQLILLFILTSLWLGTVGLLVDDVVFAGRGAGIPICGGFTVCQGPNQLSEIVATLWVALFWLGYGFLSRDDRASVLRRVLHFISFGYGMIFVLIGVYHVVTLVLLSLLKVPVEQRAISGSFAEYDVVAPLSFGLIVIGVYVFWLRMAVRQRSDEKVSINLTLQAIAAALMGVSFWWGCGLVLLDVLEKFIPSSTQLTTEAWATAFAFVITGLGYVPLDILLRRRSAKAAFLSPLRGFIFVLLGGGILAGAIGGASALYAYGTSLLGSPFDNWQFTAHAGTAAFAVGIAVVGIYLWTSMREGFFGGRSKQPAQAEAAPATPPGEAASPATHTTPVSPDAIPVMTVAQVPSTAPTTVATATIGDILDELLAGTITRDEAITRIESLFRVFRAYQQ